MALSSQFLLNSDSTYFSDGVALTATVPATGELTIIPGGEINIGSATTTGTLNTGGLVNTGVFSFIGGALGITSGG